MSERLTLGDAYAHQMEQEIYALLSKTVEARKGLRNPEDLLVQAKAIERKCKVLESRIAAFFDKDAAKRQRLMEAIAHLRMLFFGPKQEDHVHAKALEHIQELATVHTEYHAMVAQAREDLIGRPSHGPAVSPLSVLVLLAAIIAVIGMKLDKDDQG